MTATHPVTRAVTESVPDGAAAAGTRWYALAPDGAARTLGVDPAVGFIAAFLGAALFGIAGGIPFSSLAVLWLNVAVTVPIAIALGFDQPSGDRWLLCVGVAATLLVDEAIKIVRRRRGAPARHVPAVSAVPVATAPAPRPA
jgi:hypothetical protein